MTLPIGTDTSFNQRLVDWWGAFFDGVRFAYIRWGQRKDWHDSYAKRSWIESKESPIARGAYWVWDERDGDGADEHMDGVREVNAEINGWGIPYDGDLPFAADLELEPVSWDELQRWLLLLELWAGRRPDIYTGSWFYDRVKPIPDWLSEYNHWLTGYNETGPDVWGPMESLDPFIICWQDSPAWQVAWTESGYTDRDKWWPGEAHLKEYANMAQKMVKVADLNKWILENQVDAEEVGDGPGVFNLVWPAPPPVVVTQWHGINPQWYPGQKGHEGLDIRAPNRTQVFAGAAGKVYRTENDPESGAYGRQVRIEHPHPDGPFKSVYAHLMSITVNEGDDVEAGETIGLADNTGNSSGAHLHLTLKKVGDGSDWLQMGDIVNPVPYLPAIFPGGTWLVDVNGNLRTTPVVSSSNLIRLVRADEIVRPTGIFTGDWWEITVSGGQGWFWNPGYKLFPA